MSLEQKIPGDSENSIEIKEKDTPSWARYDATLEEIFKARPDQKYAPREWFMRNVDSKPARQVVENFFEVLISKIHKTTDGSKSAIDWDVLAAFESAAADLDWRFARAEDDQVEAQQKHMVGGELQIFKTLLQAKIDEIRNITSRTVDGKLVSVETPYDVIARLNETLEHPEEHLREAA